MLSALLNTGAYIQESFQAGLSHISVVVNSESDMSDRLEAAAVITRVAKTALSWAFMLSVIVAAPLLAHSFYFNNTLTVSSTVGKVLGLISLACAPDFYTLQSPFNRLSVVLSSEHDIDDLSLVVRAINSALVSLRGVKQGLMITGILVVPLIERYEQLLRSFLLQLPSLPDEYVNEERECSEAEYNAAPPSILTFEDGRQVEHTLRLSSHSGRSVVDGAVAGADLSQLFQAMGAVTRS